MTKQELLDSIDARKRAIAEAQTKARAEIKLHDYYRQLVRWHGEGKGVEAISELTGKPVLIVFDELLAAAEWWNEARKHIDANLETLLHPPEDN